MSGRKHWSRLLGVCMAGMAAIACADEITTPALSESEPSESVSAGEKFVAVEITNPDRPSFSLRVGQNKQMTARLRYNRGGSLPSAPYAQWMSTNNCVASVTNSYGNWGKVTGVKAGTALIIVTAFGKADTVKVKVEGTGNRDSGCEKREWSWDYDDISFTGKPASSYNVRAGEKLKRLVLFAPKEPLRVGEKTKVISELWYDKGGKLNGAGYVTFMSTDGSIATINSKGVVTGRSPGRVKLIARLGTSYADTVPLIVQR